MDWHLNKVVFSEIDFLLKFAIDSTSSPIWRLVTWTQICASLNHRKKMKAEPIWLTRRKLVANVEVLIVSKYFSLFENNSLVPQLFNRAQLSENVDISPQSLTRRKLFANEKSTQSWIYLASFDLCHFWPLTSFLPQSSSSHALHWLPGQSCYSRTKT